MCTNEEDKDMAVAESVKIDVARSISDSLNEVDQIRKGKLPKSSYKETIKRVREDLEKDK